MQMIFNGKMMKNANKKNPFLDSCAKAFSDFQDLVR